MRKELKIHSITYNFIMNCLLKISGVIFPLITFPYISRVLLPEMTGRVAFAESVVSYFTLFASLGIPAYGVRKCAEVRDDRQKLSKTVQELLIINFASTILAYIIFFLIVLSTPKLLAESKLLYVFSLTIALKTFGVEWFYESIEQYDYITIRNLVFKIFSVVLLFVFIKRPEDYLKYSFILVLGTAGSNILNIVRINQFITIKPIKKYDLKKHIQPIIVLFFYYAATTIYTNLDIVMLGFLCGNKETGYYNAAIRIKNVLVSIITALGVVVLPRSSYYLSKGQEKEFELLVKRGFGFTCFVAIAISVFFTVMSFDVILLLAGKDFSNANLSMKFVMPSMIFIGISSVTAWQLLIPLGRDKYTLIGALLGALMDFILNLLLIPMMGATGAAIGTLIAEVVVVIVHFYGLRDQISKLFNYRDTIILLGIAVFDGIVTYKIMSFIKINLLMNIAISSIMFFSIYLVLSTLMHISIVKYTLNYISANFAKKLH